MEKFCLDNSKRNLLLTLIIFLILILSTLSYVIFIGNEDKDQVIQYDQDEIVDKVPNIDSIIKEGPLSGSNTRKNDNYDNQDDFLFTINQRIIFKNSHSLGSVKIENPKSNIYDFYVKIKLKDNNDLVYESPILKPDHHIDSDYLKVKLNKGLYKAVATIFVIDPKTQENITQNDVNIEIKVNR